MSQGEPEQNGNSGSTLANQKYKYDFVINNYTDEEVYEVSQTLKKIAKKCIVAKEVGECGTPHLQCYVSLKRKARITSLNKLPGLTRAHFGECRNEKALVDYCRKDGVIVMSMGFPQPVKIITELRPWQKEIEDLFLTPPDDRSIHWFWEPVGNIGKSAFVKYMVVKHGALFCDGGKKADLINLVFNNDMDNCRAVIWDIPRCSKGNVSYGTLEAIKNGLVCNTKYETGTKAFNPPHVFVFANFPPEDEDGLSLDRWKITQIV